jgi:hypothetical protein
LAIAGSTKEIFAEPFIAIGVAVAFCYFFAKEKVIGFRGYERPEYNLKIKSKSCLSGVERCFDSAQHDINFINRSLFFISSF